jgi:hypothetical protein
MVTIITGIQSALNLLDLYVIGTEVAQSGYKLRQMKDDQEIWVRIPEVTDFSLLQKAKYRPALVAIKPSNGYWAYLPAIKWLEREADDSLPAADKCNYAFSCTYTPLCVFILQCLIRHRKNFSVVRNREGP